MWRWVKKEGGESGGEVGMGGGQDGDIMALCIMSKCGGNGCVAVG